MTTQSSGATSPTLSEVSATAVADAGPLCGWTVARDQTETWQTYLPPERTECDVGFKLHLSAGLTSASEVLLAAIPVLAEARVPFKHVTTLERLAFLSCGRGGASQVGKFLTVYPTSPDLARQLGYDLHRATCELSGPLISSEWQLMPGSLVHYRYGGFSLHWLQLPTGRIATAMLGPTGLEVDDRDNPQVPHGVDLPFGILPQLSSTSLLVGGRYVRVTRLAQNPKGSTWLCFALDQELETDLVIKEAFAHVMHGSDGLDARERLRREADSLLSLERSDVTPHFVDYWDEGPSSFLVYELVQGPTLSSLMAAMSADGTRPPDAVLAQWGLKLCDSVMRVHAMGYVVGDIKPANLVFDGSCFRLLDMELAGPPTHCPVGGMGSVGYCSPQQSSPELGRSMQDDVYAVSATLLAAATLTEAHALPDPWSVAHIEARCDPGSTVFPALEYGLRPESKERAPSLAALRSALVTPALGEPTGQRASELFELGQDELLSLSQEIGNHLAASAEVDNRYVYWRSDHPIVGGNVGRDLYAGSAGTALFLCHLGHATGHARYVEMAAACAKWLLETPPLVPRQIPMPGLYYGDCGQGLLYLALFQATKDARWLNATFDVSDNVESMTNHSPDLMTGAAGTGIFQLSLWHATGDSTAIDRALELANWLIHHKASDSPTWVIPSGHEGLSGKTYIGLSHGSAGIGYFLAECALARPQEDLKSTCRSIADWIIAAGRPCLHDNRGMTWSATKESRQAHPAHWCHGAGGITRFLISAHELLGGRDLEEGIRRAATLVADGPRWPGPTQCHGLAGNIEILVDVAAHLRGERWHGAASRLAHNLNAYRTERGWPSEARDVISPDLMVGQAGVGLAYLRLAEPGGRHAICPRVFESQSELKGGSDPGG